MTFEHPWLLLAAVPLAWVTVAVARRGVVTVPARQHRWSVALRVVAVAALVAAAAQPSVELAVADRTVFFLLDRSDSIGDASRALQEEIVAEALDLARPVDRVGVGVFGAALEVDTALTLGLQSVEVGVVSEGSATDLDTALRSAAALLPSEGSRRIVVLTDLVPTTGDARAAAAALADAGIAIDVVALDAQRSADALVESVRLPATVRTGDVAVARVTIRSNQAGPALLRVTGAEGDPIELDVDLEAGSQVVEVEVPVDGSGSLTLTAEVDAVFDTRPENDRSSAVSRILGTAHVVVVEGVDGEATELAAALEAGGLAVDVVRSIPDEVTLLGADALVLVNVAAPTAEESERVAAFVEDLGRGLLVVGGDRAYGLGDYHESPIEALLPVSSDPDDLVRRQPVAEVLVIDTSGSMGRCHCNEGQFAEGGVDKTDISRAGATLAIEALADSDRVGVLAFSSGTDWVIPLGAKPDPATVETALGGLIPNGDTEIAVALEQALAELEGVPDALRHIVLFTDGWDPNDANLVPIARRIADAGVTLSVLGTGEGPGTTLQRMADVGGGRFYPGRDLSTIPEVFVEETLTVARNLATEGSFLPALRVPSAATDTITATPPLLGYVLAKSKATAAVHLEIGQGDPLLASWQRGLGRVTAWTSDATRRWAAGWVTWDGYVEFWGAAVRELLPPGRERAPEVFVRDGVLRVIAGAEGLGDAAAATVRIRRPDGSAVAVPMQRVSEGEFVAETPAPAPGAYWAAVTIDDGSGGASVAAAGAVSSYEAEFAFGDPDPTLGADVAAITGGRLDPASDSVFDAAPSIGRTSRPIWPWLAGLALAAFMADVALRRLVLVEGDGSEWREGLQSTTRRERRRVERIEAERRAAPEPDRSTASDSETLERLMRRKR